MWGTANRADRPSPVSLDAKMTNLRGHQQNRHWSQKIRCSGFVEPLRLVRMKAISCSSTGSCQCRGIESVPQLDCSRLGKHTPARLAGLGSNLAADYQRGICKYSRFRIRNPDIQRTVLCRCRYRGFPAGYSFHQTGRPSLQVAPCIPKR